MVIKKQICKNWSEREGYVPSIIVVHISAGSLTSMTSWFSTPNSQASAHYGISKSGEIIRYVPEKFKAWSQGNVKNPTAKIILGRPNINPNLYAISIENEGQDLQYAPETQLNALYELITDICDRYSIPKDREHILGHFEIDGINRSYCPSPNHAIMDKIVNKLFIKTSKENLLKKILELQQLAEKL